LNKEISIKRIEHESQSSSFWQDSKTAKDKQKEISAAKRDVETYNSMARLLGDIQTSVDLLTIQEDQQLEQELSANMAELTRKLDVLESSRMFSGPYDGNSAIMTITAGAGGTESQDWTGILLRMYVRWLEKKGFKVSEVEMQHGDIAGLKTVTIRIEGDNAYGLLKLERGVHRFMRISPFDANKKRQTSFARVDLIPILEDNAEIKIEKSDLEIDIYRASGPGGQHRNKVETAVRIRHIPSGIVVRSEGSRSQGDNKESAMAELRNRLAYAAELEKKKKIDAIAGEKKDVSFGHQIRTYIVHSRRVVVDERTGKQYQNVDNVLNGDLDELVYDCLRAS
jgi:peptide chain release factor 2